MSFQRSVFLIFSLMLFQIIVCGQEVYSNQVIIEEDCQGETIVGNIGLYLVSNEPINVFNLSSTISDIEFSIDQKRIEYSDSIKLIPQERFLIQFKFNVSDIIEDNFITYSTSIENENMIEINLGSYIVSHEDIRSTATKVIDISQNCSDSIKIYFPYGGTVSSVSIHSSESEMEDLKSTSYGNDHETNFIKFSKSECGRYFVRFMACHWGDNFWLEIK